MGIMQRLREETRDCHDRLETRLGLPASVSFLPEYRALLIRFYGFYVPIEMRLAFWLDNENMTDAVLSSLDYPVRRKTSLLQQDLQALGLTEAERAALPRCETLPRLDTLPRALGCLYVLEGSTLGGQLLARSFAAALGIEATNGGAFFHSYGLEIGARWRAFGQCLTAWDNAQHRDAQNAFASDDRNRSAQEAMISTARETFRTLEAWLCSGD